MSCVCVHLPAIGVYAMWQDALLPLQFPYITRKEIETSHIPTVECFVLFSQCIC